MFYPNNKSLFYNEFNKFTIDENYLDRLWENEIMRTYIFLINNIKQTINGRIFLNEYEWEFYKKKLKFCKNLLLSCKIDIDYKLILLDNIKAIMGPMGI